MGGDEREKFVGKSEECGNLVSGYIGRSEMATQTPVEIDSDGNGLYSNVELR